MHSIIFVDTEIAHNSRKILDIGAVKDDGSSFHKNSLDEFIQFLHGAQFICGHNIFNHDLRYIGKPVRDAGINESNIIDTLFLSPLLFPASPYHSLLKDDKLQSEDTNNPLNDSIKAKDLFYAEVTAFKQMEKSMQDIFHLLLKDKREFTAFFKFINYTDTTSLDIEALVREKFKNNICEQATIVDIISQQPIELAYCLSLINANDRYAITPRWVLKNYPRVEQIMFQLRNKPCITGCAYCHQELDIHRGFKKWFGLDSFRTFGGEPLQEKAVKAAIDDKSILAVFPTGGGKSVTFQLPALMSGENSKALTVVISPLQSLMKDQVDNLANKYDIVDAVTINGSLHILDRRDAFNRVENGSATILYISPESLRSRSVERLILGRKIARFVIDEAHCFSSWGQDFRVDYLYIGDFVKSIQQKKNLEEAIPISCFTATAKQKVISDIQRYFKEKLSIDLELFTSKVARTNLQYNVFGKKDEEEKYLAVRDLIEQKNRFGEPSQGNCPTIIYVSKTRKAQALAERLTKDGFNAKPYHGKMDKQEKADNQNAFMKGDTDIMVATSAFGMGVDKKDVGMVIHYEISDSLENYIQEAGRAGRDENLKADCFVLFNEEDLSKHFIMLNQTKLSIKEIQQIWKAIKDITRFRSTVSNSALEIARKAGWDDSVLEIETRVTTAISALEDAGYLRRGQNMPRVFASSILSKTAQEATDKIMASERFSEQQKVNGTRIIKKLFSSKSRKHSSEESAESRVDYISDHLGIIKEDVVNVVHLLREENILADTKDLTAFVKKGENKNRSLHIVEVFGKIEGFLLNLLSEEEQKLHIKELNEAAEINGCNDVSTAKIKAILNFWTAKKWIKRKNLPHSRNHIAVHCLYPIVSLRQKWEKRYELARFIVGFLYEKSSLDVSASHTGKEEVLVEFSVHELKEAYENALVSFGEKVSIDDVEDTLFYLSRMEAIKIEGGFLVLYNSLTIERIEQDNKKRYTKDDYQKLNEFYENKVQQIHIVGEYAKKMMTDYKNALQFVEDYFQLNYTSFLKKYFPGSKVDDLKLKMTPTKFKQLFGELSPTQLKIINENESKHIVVAAGPGSGKTRVLVHKLASLLLMEDVKHEQLLMLTFSRAAATEFKKRLLQLIGNAAHYVEIKTFHSYCFDLLGKVGNLEKSDVILKRTIEKIRNKEVETSRITKTVLVIDEAQDMNEDEFDLINVLMQQNEEMRVIAVGDDDQNIYGFRGANSKYLKQFIQIKDTIKHELVENYRSKSNLVKFANQFVEQISHRLKEVPNVAIQADNGKIKIVKYHSKNLINPLVQDILTTDLSGTTCVLTKTNEEALQITGLLLKNGMLAKLVQTNDGFNLRNLVEIRFFLEQLDLMNDIFTISEDIWENAKRELIRKYGNSVKLEICLHIIKDFEATNPKTKYKSDLDVFIRESKLEDFLYAHGESILVSTIHKAKGREFDNVFLLLENFKPTTDEAKRQLYVAMTRVKQNLNMHTDSDFLPNLSGENLERIENRESHLPPSEIVLHLTHSDVQLSYFGFVQHRVQNITSGDILIVSDEGCKNTRGELVLKFSKKFCDTIKAQENKGYTPRYAKANFMVYWLNEDIGQDLQIILPEICFITSRVTLL